MGMERGYVRRVYEADRGDPKAGRLCWRLEIWGNRTNRRGRVGGMEVWAKGSGVLAVSRIAWCCILFIPNAK